jgi:hypothetical protein
MRFSSEAHAPNSNSYRCVIKKGSLFKPKKSWGYIHSQVRKLNTRKDFILSQCLFSGLTGSIIFYLLQNIGKCCAELSNNKQTVIQQ